MFLVDTNILSVNAPGRPPHRAVANWMELNTDQLFLSVVTIAEIEDGIAKSRWAGATAKAHGLTLWLDTVIHLHADRIFAFDLAIARLAGALLDRARAGGQAPGFADLIIAATAQHHGLKVLTRNVRHFLPLGVAVIDPFVSLP